MKPMIESLRVGQKVWAVVEEVIVNNEIIVNFQGDLLRVSNQSKKKFRPGQRIQLSVVQSYPLQFQLIDVRRATHLLDLSI